MLAIVVPPPACRSRKQSQNIAAVYHDPSFFVSQDLKGTD
jgi:hypothetical protein